MDWKTLLDHFRAQARTTVAGLAKAAQERVAGSKPGGPTTPTA